MVQANLMDFACVRKKEVVFEIAAKKEEEQYSAASFQKKVPKDRFWVK